MLEEWMMVDHMEIALRRLSGSFYSPPSGWLGVNLMPGYELVQTPVHQDMPLSMNELLQR
jgi:hypothetical protein